MDKEQEAQEKCPLCTQRSNDSDINDDQDDDLWLQCDGCATWFHTYCLRLSRSECDSIDQFYCESCTKVHGPTTYKPETRKSSRERTRLNYADLNEGNTADQRIWAKLLAAKTFAEDRFPRYSGHEVNLELLNETGMKVPFIVEDPEGLDMKMPSPDTTVRDVAEAVGRDYPVDVIDVATQSEQAGWTMGRWADYYHSPKRDRIRNVISLEITGTDFAEGIKRPRIVREIDWIDHMWPKDDRPEEYPKVQLYCLMGTKDSYTDFHIDFGGSSVFYHVVSGSKIFYFIEPTKTHLKKYQKWSSSSEQSTTFFGDEVKKCYAVHIKAGNTMIIPTGWIHAVYTPEDALVIGGNFLHGYNIETQIRIYEIEQITEVPLKFQFPYFLRMNLYAAMRYKELLEQGATLSHFELAGILKLAKWLRDILENPKGKKSASQGFVPKLSKTDIPSSLQNPKKLVCDLLELVHSKIEEETEAIKRSREEISTEPSQNQIKRVRLMATKPEKSPVKKPLPDETRAFEFLQGRAYEQAILGELEDDDKEIKVVDTTKDDDYTWNGANDGDDDAIYSSADDDENEYTEKKKSSRQSMPRTIQQKKKPTTVKQRLLARIEKPPKRH